MDYYLCSLCGNSHQLNRVSGDSLIAVDFTANKCIKLWDAAGHKIRGLLGMAKAGNDTKTAWSRKQNNYEITIILRLQHPTRSHISEDSTTRKHGHSTFSSRTVAAFCLELDPVQEP